MTDPEKMHNSRRMAPSNHPLAGSERSPLPNSKYLETAPADETITIRLIVRRRPDGPAMRGLEDFFNAPLAARTRLSRKEFEEAHGATQGDLDDVKTFCGIHGLSVLEANRSRRSVLATGSVTRMNAAFGVQLQNYQSSTRKYHSHEGSIQLPAALDGIVEAVFGLDNRPVHAIRLSSDPSPTNPLTPLKVAQLYNFPQASGDQQVIGIFEMPAFDAKGVYTVPGYTAQDLSLTMNAWEPDLVIPSPIDFPSGSNTGLSVDETILDIAVASAIAPEATFIVYFAASDAVIDIHTTLLDMINPLDHIAHLGWESPTIISISYVWSADDLTNYISSTEYGQLHQLFSEAASFGITVLASTGDSGPYLEYLYAQTSYPASDPYVLACGGTTVGAIRGSSFEEYVWNDDGVGATGGGISALFSVPSYQNAVALPKRLGTGTSGRGIPDVAGNASPNSGYPVFLQGKYAGPRAGTSAVSPLYAGLVARINQLLGENVGFLNPTLYQNATTICRDVTGAAGPTNNSFNGVTGYSAAVGWDACTGLGSIDGTALLSACTPPPPPLTKSDCEEELESFLFLIREGKVPVEYGSEALEGLRECVDQGLLTEAQYAYAVAALKALAKDGSNVPPSRGFQRPSS